MNTNYRVACLIVVIITVCILLFAMFLKPMILEPSSRVDNYAGHDLPPQNSSELVSTLTARQEGITRPIIVFVMYGTANSPLVEATFYPGSIFIYYIFVFALLTVFIKLGFRYHENVKQASVPDLSILHEKLVDHFDMTELKLLCLELKIDDEEVRGEGKTEKVLELIKYCKRRGRIQELIGRARQHRSHAAWP
jgi:hypothetical protein